MKCPECEKQDLKSTVQYLYGTSTAMAGGGTWWDEDGNEHYTDVNWHTSQYRCSNGHEFQITQEPSTHLVTRSR